MIETVTPTSLSVAEALAAFLHTGFQSGGSFALWRKPKSSKLEFVLDELDGVRKVGMNLEELPAGFIIHPFEDQENKQAYFINASNYLSIDLASDLKEADLPQWIQAPKNIEYKSLLKTVGPEQNSEDLSQKIHDGDSKEHFQALVEQSISEIEKGNLEKVVPARTKHLDLPEEFDLAKAIKSMLDSYPNSFVNFFHIPQVGTWMGASPEVLIETQGDYFHTMSLAGTQAAKGDNPLKSVAWTQKEIEEQALVSRYIVDCFKKIRLREYEEHGPKTVMAGNLLHLRSDFKVNMKATNFPQLGSVMLDLLHPTSAVCGMPRKEAHEFLKANEGFDRSFFAGFLGPVNIDNTTSIYVNLRTASFQDGKVTLYAGAGVTEDSDPEKEWEETEMKCEIIGKFIQKSIA